MKKLLIVLFVVFVFTANAFAVDTMAFTSTGDSSSIRVKAVCTAAADGTFTSRTITTELGFAYENGDYYLLDAWAVNSATDDHTNAAVVTITDDTGRQLIGAAAGDTLTLSQTASAIAYASMTRSASQRSIKGRLTIAIADTGSTATVQTIYLVLGK